MVSRCKAAIVPGVLMQFSLVFGPKLGQLVWTLSLGLRTTSRQFTAELWGFSRPPDELTKRCANPSGGSKPRHRERARVGAPGAAQGGRFVEIELVQASGRERLVGGEIGDKSRETRGKRPRREGALPAWLVNWIGRGFRSASFSSPNVRLSSTLPEGRARDSQRPPTPT